MVMYLVEQPIMQNGKQVATCRFYTGDQEKAERMAAEVPTRKLITLEEDDIPADVLKAWVSRK